MKMICLMTRMASCREEEGGRKGDPERNKRRDFSV